MAEIKPPDPNSPREAVRVVAEALAQGTPVTAGLARLYQYTHPSKFERDLQKWRLDMSGAVNGILDHLNPKLIVSDTTLEVARCLSELATNGYSDNINFDKISGALSDFAEAEIQQACFDLEQRDFVSLERAGMKPVMAVRPGPNLFKTFDPYFLDSDPTSDAVELARELLKRQGAVVTRQFEAEIGWPRRRFNPAFSMVVYLLPSNSFRRPNQPDYAATNFRILPEVRACLERFVSEQSAQPQ